MKKITYKILLSILLIALSAAQLSSAQENEPTNNQNRLQYGTLELEVEKKREDPYKVTQDKAIKLFEDLVAQVKANGLPSSIPVANESSVNNYLAASYLLCSIKLGSCQFFLDSLLELEVINSRLAKKASCPTLEGFWRAWIGANMEERLNYQLKTSLINEISTFRNKVRPKYIRCVATVQSEIEGASDNKIFFANRYNAENSNLKSIEKSLTFLNELKEKQPNIFAAVGIKQGEDTKKSEAGKKK